MTGWVITSWVFVILLTTVNVFVFLKLKGVSEQMMKMAFPNAKNMGEAMAQAQKLMGQMGGNRDAQLKQAMQMLQNKNRR